MSGTTSESLTQPRTREDMTDEFVKRVCRIGQGRQCCRYVSFGAGGWDCEKYKSTGLYIDQRVERGEMNARGDNCGGLIR